MTLRERNTLALLTRPVVYAERGTGAAQVWGAMALSTEYRRELELSLGPVPVQIAPVAEPLEVPSPHLWPRWSLALAILICVAVVMSLLVGGGR